MVDADFSGTVYDIIRTIRDPEKPSTLEDLEVVYEEGVEVEQLENQQVHIKVYFKPTIKHCSLATLIGLCIHVKLQRNLPSAYKVSVFIQEGTHNTEKEVNKQINDKERISAAMENPNLSRVVEVCIEEPS